MGPVPHRRMTREEAGRLPKVLARVGASHGITDLTCKLRFYDDWAPEYDKVKAPDCVFMCKARVVPAHPREAGSWPLLASKHHL